MAVIILGIDPGTQVMGFGVVQSQDSDIQPLAYGAYRVKPSLPMAERLQHLFEEVSRTIQTYNPDAMAVERPFFAKNATSALAIGKAQAVAILAATGRRLPVYEYTPAQIKQRIASYGASTKEQVQEMVRLQLGLADVPEPNDAADALAVAICHIQEMHLKSLLERSSQT
jgi:crossover junction endodeoxyribonuclease RuvC